MASHPPGTQARGSGMPPRPGSRPLIMGILNLTPDSFSDGGRWSTPAAAVRRARALATAGADLVDVGAESTRPGAAPVSAAEEKRRLLPVLRRLRDLSVPLSVDTYKPEVAAAALAAGARWINDITALADPAMRRLAAAARVPVVLMHMRGTPRTMQRAPRYRDVAAEVKRELLAAARRARQAGVAQDRIWLDPGLGFGKTPLHNLQLLNRLGRLAATGYPVVAGPSRKSFVSTVLGPLPPGQRGWGTAAAVALAVDRGARMVRVHDVADMRMVAEVAHAISREALPRGKAGA